MVVFKFSMKQKNNLVCCIPIRDLAWNCVYRAFYIRSIFSVEKTPQSIVITASNCFETFFSDRFPRLHLYNAYASKKNPTAIPLLQLCATHVATLRDPNLC